MPPDTRSDSDGAVFPDDTGLDHTWRTGDHNADGVTQVRPRSFLSTSVSHKRAHQGILPNVQLQLARQLRQLYRRHQSPLLLRTDDNYIDENFQREVFARRSQITPASKPAAGQYSQKVYKLSALCNDFGLGLYCRCDGAHPSIMWKASENIADASNLRLSKMLGSIIAFCRCGRLMHDEQEHEFVRFLGKLMLSSYRTAEREAICECWYPPISASRYQRQLVGNATQTKVSEILIVMRPIMSEALRALLKHLLRQMKLEAAEELQLTRKGTYDNREQPGQAPISQPVEKCQCEASVNHDRGQCRRVDKHQQKDSGRYKSPQRRRVDKRLQKASHQHAFTQCRQTTSIKQKASGVKTQAGAQLNKKPSPVFSKIWYDNPEKPRLSRKSLPVKPCQYCQYWASYPHNPVHCGRLT